MMIVAIALYALTVIIAYGAVHSIGPDISSAGDFFIAMFWPVGLGLLLIMLVVISLYKVGAKLSERFEAWSDRFEDWLDDD